MFRVPNDWGSAHGQSLPDWVIVDVVVGKAAYQIDDGTARLGVGDAHERLVELEAVAAAQELDDGVVGGALGKAVGHQMADLCRRRLLVEELHRHAQYLRQVEPPARADPVDALLALL